MIIGGNSCGFVEMSFVQADNHFKLDASTKTIYSNYIIMSVTSLVREGERFILK